MKKYRIEFTRVQRTDYEIEVEAESFEDAKRKFFKKDGKKFGGKKEIRITEIAELE